MLYRIIKAPPGYAQNMKYTVAAYETTDPISMTHVLTKSDGSRFIATLEEARRMIPAGAKRIAFEPEAQFVELWEL